MSLFLEMVKFLAPNLNQVLEEKVPMQLHSISICIKSKELKIKVASELRRKVVRHGCEKVRGRGGSGKKVCTLL